MLKRILNGVVSLLALALFMGQSAHAQEFPTRPLTLVVPYPAGGGADIIARMLGEALKEQLGQAVAVTNRPGGQGTIGTAEVIRSAPDGYNLVLSAVATLTVQPHRQDLPYKTPDDYDPIILQSDAEKIFSPLLNATIETVGDKYEDLQQRLIKASGQPNYVFVNGDGNLLIDGGYGYDATKGPKEFIAHLQKVKGLYNAGIKK
jgi:tripartite-type tricarboxylate transporter receptor subunit TctC